MTLTEIPPLYRWMIQDSETGAAHRGIQLPARVLNLGSTTNLRVINTDTGEEVPFFIYFPHSTTLGFSENIYTTTFHHGAITEEHYELTFVVNTGLNVDALLTHLSLDASVPNFLRDVTVLGSNDGQHWSPITTQQVYRVSDVDNTIIDLGRERRYTWYRLQVPRAQGDISWFVEGLHRTEVSETIPALMEVPVAFNTESSDGTTRVTIHGFGNDETLANLSITHIRINTPDMFHRTVRYWGRNFELSQFTFEDVVIIEQTTFPVEGVMGDTFFFDIIDGDNPPLSITDLWVEWEVQHLVFAGTPHGSYALYAGGELTAVSYDIAHFSQAIINRGYEMRTVVGQAQLVSPAGVVPEPRDFTLLFNIAMVVASVVLVFVGLRGFLKGRST